MTHTEIARMGAGRCGPALLARTVTMIALTRRPSWVHARSCRARASGAARAREQVLNLGSGKGQGSVRAADQPPLGGEECEGAGAEELRFARQLMADKGPRRGELDGLMGGAVKQKEEEVPAGNGDGNHILWRAESEELGAQSIADGLGDQIHEGAERAGRMRLVRRPVLVGGFQWSGDDRHLRAEPVGGQREEDILQAATRQLGALGEDDGHRTIGHPLAAVQYENVGTELLDQVQQVRAEHHGRALTCALRDRRLHAANAARIESCQWLVEYEGRRRVRGRGRWRASGAYRGTAPRAGSAAYPAAWTRPAAG